MRFSSYEKGTRCSMYTRVKLFLSLTGTFHSFSIGIAEAVQVELIESLRNKLLILSK